MGGRNAEKIKTYFLEARTYCVKSSFGFFFRVSPLGFGNSLCTFCNLFVLHFSGSFLSC